MHKSEDKKEFLAIDAHEAKPGMIYIDINDVLWCAVFNDSEQDMYWCSLKSLRLYGGTLELDLAEYKHHDMVGI